MKRDELSSHRSCHKKKILPSLFKDIHAPCEQFGEIEIQTKSLIIFEIAQCLVHHI